MKNKILILLASVLFGLLLGLVVKPGNVLAWSQTGYPCTASGSGLHSGCEGYFTGHEATINTCSNKPAPPTRPCINAEDVLNGGINAKNISDLITTITNDLKSSGQNQLGAAFIIDTMLGHNGPDANGVNYAKSQIGLWDTEVSYFDGTHPSYTVNMNYNEDCANSANLPNSSYFTDPNMHDDAYHNFICQYQDAGLDDGPAILFQWPNGGEFSIGQSCGNVQGFIMPLPDVQPVLTCSITTSPAEIDPDTIFSAIVTVSTNSGSPPTGVPVTLSINPAVTSSYTNPQLTGSSSQATFSTIGPIQGSGGTYTLTATLGGGYTGTCNLPVAVGNLPYLQVYGGDVSVTGSPELTYSSGNSIPGTGCESPQPSNPSAGIFAWNDNGTPNYSGAGSQYAVFALGEIDGFASDQYSTLGAPLAPPTALSFAYPGPSGSGPFGGVFGQANTTGDCNFTYDCLFVVASGGVSNNCPNKLPICNVFCTTVDTGNGAPYMIPDGKTKTIFTFGSIYITNNIEYQQPPGGWTSPSEIPNFRLVVLDGNIYIGPNVTELDGLYVAEPSNNNKGGKWAGGTIYTCATGSLQGKTTPTISPTLISSYDTTCGKPLSIYGAFVAQQVEFLRTHGTLGGASAATNNPSCMVLVPNGATGQNTCNAAETFEYSPELWLPRNTNAANNNYTSISGLPPVL